MKNIYTIISIIVFTIISCQSIETEIDIKTVYEGDKIVIHGFVSDMDGVEVIVKKTTSVIGNVEDNKLKDVTVMLYENDSAVGYLERVTDEKFIMKGDFKAQRNKAYHLEVNSTSLGTARSKKQYIPEGIHIEIDSLEQSNYSSKYNYNVTYILRYNSHYPQQMMGKIEHKIFGEEMFQNNYAQGKFSTYINIESGNNFIEDVQYSGTCYECDSSHLRLIIYSDDLAQFAKTSWSYVYANDDEFNELDFWVHSNIEGGYGIFGAYTYSHIKTNIIKYVYESGSQVCINDSCWVVE